MTIYRAGNASGNSFVEMNIADTGSMVLNCDCLTFDECQCGIYLASSGIQSQPANLTYLDDIVYQNVIVSVWLVDESLLQPVDAVLTLLEHTILVNYSNTAVLEISPSQQSGFASFTQSRTHILENSTFVQVNVVRLNGSSGNISFDVDSFDITSVSSRDYVPVQQTITLQDRQSVVSVWISLIDDFFYRGTRIFGLRLTPSDHSLSLVTHRVVIFDDDDIANIVPGIPTSLTLIGSSGGELTISWRPPTNGQVIGYIVHVSKNASDTSGIFSLYNVTQTSIVLSNLTYKSSYVTKVAAWNSLGVGDFGDPITSSTTSPTRPSNPVNLRAAQLGSHTVQLIWDASQDNGGLEIDHYMIWTTTNGTNFEEISRVSAPQTFGEVKDLDSYTIYTFYVAAGTSMYPAAISSELANLTVKTANESVPYKPKAVNLYSKQTAGTLSLQVTAYNDTLRHVSGYTVYLRPYVNTQDEVAEPFMAVCDEFSAKIRNAWGTCVVYKLLANTSYETYATFSNSAVSKCFIYFPWLF